MDFTLENKLKRQPFRVAFFAAVPEKKFIHGFSQ